MTNLLMLIPVALVLGALGLVGFLWALRSGQFDDLDGAANRILFDYDADAERPAGGAPATDQTAGAPATDQTAGAPATDQTAGAPAKDQTAGAPAKDQTAGALAEGQAAAGRDAAQEAPARADSPAPTAGPPRSREGGGPAE